MSEEAPQEKAQNLLARLPEAIVILILAGLLGYQETKTTTEKDLAALRSDLERLRAEFNEMHPR